jgi:hypothetical protein
MPAPLKTTVSRQVTRKRGDIVVSITKTGVTIRAPHKSKGLSISYEDIATLALSRVIVRVPAGLSPLDMLPKLSRRKLKHETS